METPAQQSFCFGPFVLDPVERVLHRDGHALSLPPKAIETLLALVERHGHVVHKAELLQRIWPDTYVEEVTLAQNISTLRKALNGSSNTLQYIETVPKRGYRFVAPVHVGGPTQDSQASGRTASRGISRASLWPLAAIVVMALAAGVYVRGRARSSAGMLRGGKATLAVLPFENFTGDTTQDYLSDGLTEEMIAQLSRINPERLRVIARTTAMQYKGTHKSIAQIGGELGADYLLESSFRREGNRVRITTQLARANDQTHLWSQNYERDVREILPLETEVAQNIAHEIEIKLSPQEQARLAGHSAIDPEAYQLYLEGRYFWNKRNRGSLHKAVDYFQRAIEKDHNFALAYSGLADSYALEDYFQELPVAERMGRAKAAAEKALQLDDTLAETHTSMTLTGGWSQTPEETEAHFKRALELNPNYATAHHWYSLFLKDTGRIEQAIVEIERARELDPLSLVINGDRGLVYYYARHYDTAIEACQKTLEMDANFRLAHWELGMAYESKAMYPEALKEYQIAVQLAPDYPLMYAYLARAYALAGDKEQARVTLRHLESMPPASGKPIGVMAIVYDVLGNKDKALAALQAAYEAREISLSWSLQLEPRFDDLRPDPRFQELLRRANLPVSPTASSAAHN